MLVDNAHAFAQTSFPSQSCHIASIWLSALDTDNPSQLARVLGGSIVGIIESLDTVMNADPARNFKVKFFRYIISQFVKYSNQSSLIITLHLWSAASLSRASTYSISIYNRDSISSRLNNRHASPALRMCPVSINLSTSSPISDSNAQTLLVSALDLEFGH